MGVPAADVAEWQAAFLLDEAARESDEAPAALKLAAALLPGTRLLLHPHPRPPPHALLYTYSPTYAPQPCACV